MLLPDFTPLAVTVSGTLMNTRSLVITFLWLTSQTLAIRLAFTRTLGSRKLPLYNRMVN
jgi:hypothetical protein